MQSCFAHGSGSQGTWIPLLILPPSITCDHNSVAQHLCAPVVLLIKRDCSFLLYRADTGRPNSSYYLQMILRSQAESYYVNIKYIIMFCCKTKKILIVHCLSNQFLVGIQIKIIAFHIIWKRQLVTAWQKNTLENSSTVISTENTSGFALLSFLFNSEFLPHMPCR